LPGARLTLRWTFFQLVGPVTRNAWTAGPGCLDSSNVTQLRPCCSNPVSSLPVRLTSSPIRDSCVSAMISPTITRRPALSSCACSNEPSITARCFAVARLPFTVYSSEPVPR
jgi:hypothetical protein